MKAKANIASATDKFILGPSSSSSGRALGSDKACGMGSLSDSPMLDGGLLEVALEAVAITVRFLDTERRIRRNWGCSSDFTKHGSLSPHIFLCEKRWKSWKAKNTSNKAVGKRQSQS